ncbi:hypothetical protein IU487_27730 [Nocardia puris]|nr:hypothetical protein [Nocardia puris]MBF6214795.1 hypothetical protein [Nocardia puris]
MINQRTVSGPWAAGITSAYRDFLIATDGTVVARKYGSYAYYPVDC